MSASSTDVLALLRVRVTLALFSRGKPWGILEFDYNSIRIDAESLFCHPEAMHWRQWAADDVATYGNSLRVVHYVWRAADARSSGFGVRAKQRSCLEVREALLLQIQVW
jgi:hypothetical protein